MPLCKVERMISITTGEDPEQFNCTLLGLLPTGSKHYCQIAYPITVFRRPFKYVNNCKCKCLFLSCLSALFQICHNFRVTALKKHPCIFEPTQLKERTPKCHPYFKKVAMVRFYFIFEVQSTSQGHNISSPFFQWKHTAHKTVFIFCNRILFYFIFLQIPATKCIQVLKM